MRQYFQIKPEMKSNVFIMNSGRTAEVSMRYNSRTLILIKVVTGGLREALGFLKLDSKMSCKTTI